MNTGLTCRFVSPAKELFPMVGRVILSNCNSVMSAGSCGSVEKDRVVDSEEKAE